MASTASAHPPCADPQSCSECSDIAWEAFLTTLTPNRNPPNPLIAAVTRRLQKLRVGIAETAPPFASYAPSPPAPKGAAARKQPPVSAPLIRIELEDLREYVNHYTARGIEQDDAYLRVRHDLVRSFQQDWAPLATAYLDNVEKLLAAHVRTGMNQHLRDFPSSMRAAVRKRIIGACTAKTREQLGYILRYELDHCSTLNDDALNDRRAWHTRALTEAAASAHAPPAQVHQDTLAHAPARASTPPANARPAKRKTAPSTSVPVSAPQAKPKRKAQKPRRPAGPVLEIPLCTNARLWQRRHPAQEAAAAQSSSNAQKTNDASISAAAGSSTGEDALTPVPQERTVAPLPERARTGAGAPGASGDDGKTATVNANMAQGSRQTDENMFIFTGAAGAANGGTHQPIAGQSSSGSGKAQATRPLEVEYEKEIECMAEVAAYFDIAHMRFLDNVRHAVDHHLLTTVAEEMRGDPQQVEKNECAPVGQYFTLDYYGNVASFVLS